MERTIRRPIAVWISQVVLVLCAFAEIAFFILVIYRVATDLRSLASTQEIEYLALTFGFLGLSLIIFALTFWGLQKRKSYGRYLVTLLFVTSCIFAVRELILLAQVWFGFENVIGYSPEFLVKFYVSVTTAVILLPLITSLVLSKNVNIFFSQEAEHSLGGLPPPPPSFDA